MLQGDKVTSNGATSRMPGGYDLNFVHCPSEITSTEASTTLRVRPLARLGWWRLMKAVGHGAEEQQGQ
ncbi:hypothetical protein ACFYRJ_29255 [Streptomyces sp. NPDC005531]|uniref:hypothetical protein n=1 Tax=Streptomyces sp. NPDC005531 TaxID=3364722 RepID=UPI0036BBC6B8